MIVSYLAIRGGMNQNEKRRLISKASRGAPGNPET
jgi:hypothetical protein